MMSNLDSHWLIMHPAMTILMKLTGLRIPGVQSNLSVYATIRRKVINQSQKLGCGSLIPGFIKSSAKSRGKTLPAGLVQGAWFLCDLVALKHLAIDCRHRSQSLSLWTSQFCV